MQLGRLSITLRRIRFKPWVYLCSASLSLCFSVYIPESSLPAVFVFMGSGFFCAALGTAWFGAPAGTGGGSRTFAAPFLIALAAGMIAGGGVHYTSLRDAPFTGLKREKVVGITGICGQDSTSLSPERFSVPLRLERVEAANGIQTGASGMITVFADSPRPAYKGERIVLEGRFDPEGEDLFFGNNLSADRNRKFAASLYRFRYSALTGIKNRIRRTGARSAPLFEALFLGVKENLGILEGELFKRAGASHILALSGMHLGIIGGLLFVVLRPLIGKRRAFYVLSFIILIYIGLTGFRSALLRAGLMFFLFGLGRIYGRKPDIRSVFFASFLLLSVLTPGALFSLSFQLSFLALGGILFITPVLHSAWRGYIPDPVSLPVSASIGAQTAGAPIVAASFGVIYPVGILSSMIITPLVTVFMAGGIAALIMPVPAVSSFLFFILDHLYDIITALLRFAGFVPALNIQSDILISILWIGPALCLLLPLFISFRRRKQYRILYETA